MLDYTISSGNIFQDLGFANAEEKLAKVKLASVIADILEQQQITPQQAAQILGLELEQINNLTNGILKEFTIENLLSYLIKLGQNVEIMVTNQQQDKSQPKINVVYQKNCLMLVCIVILINIRQQSLPIVVIK
ncbi:helix-turn-helix domain-containing protein [Aphanizomenon flos-aquae]|uniref:helix-turn-helix domain-containing protein n=1 Tax=Aphanizomenon flos-aquae TaxID=1176 RepID=UPI0009078305|nr:helix-turn-helix transcriptional regulator [Aphanizomenon flos-aquae]